MQLGVTLRTLYRLIDEGRLPAYKMGRVIRLKASDVTSFSRTGHDNLGGIEHLLPGEDDPGLSGVREPRNPRPSQPPGTHSRNLPDT